MARTEPDAINVTIRIDVPRLAEDQQRERLDHVALLIANFLAALRYTGAQIDGISLHRGDELVDRWDLEGK